MLELIKLDEFGLWYMYKGDEICLPSTRYRIRGKVWYSLLADCGFNSLNEMDNFWKGYWEALKN